MSKHPQHDMLIAIAKDESLALRVERFTGDSYTKAMARDLIDLPDNTYRFKPREFKISILNKYIIGDFSENTI